MSVYMYLLLLYLPHISISSCSPLVYIKPSVPFQPSPHVPPHTFLTSFHPPLLYTMRILFSCSQPFQISRSAHLPLSFPLTYIIYTTPAPAPTSVPSPSLSCIHYAGPIPSSSCNSLFTHLSFLHLYSSLPPSCFVLCAPSFSPQLSLHRYPIPISVPLSCMYTTICMLYLFHAVSLPFCLCCVPTSPLVTLFTYLPSSDPLSSVCYVGRRRGGRRQARAARGSRWKHPRRKSCRRLGTRYGRNTW